MICWTCNEPGCAGCGYSPEPVAGVDWKSRALAAEAVIAEIRGVTPDHVDPTQSQTFNAVRSIQAILSLAGVKR